MSASLATESGLILPTGHQNDLLSRALQLPREPDRALAFPLGSSTFRVLVVDRAGQVLDRIEVQDPASYYDNLYEAMAAVQLALVLHST